MIKLSLETVPEQFQSELSILWERYLDRIDQDKVSILQSDAILDSLPKVWVCSRFIADSCIRDPDLLPELVRSGDLQRGYLGSSYAKQLNKFDVESEQDLHRVLRVFRRREMVRIAWRDIAGWSQLDETLNDVSLLAESTIQFALDYVYRQACEKYGPPIGKDGDSLQMVVLGMGKLGARELNYSSDVDLIFAIPEEGYFNDRKGTSYSEFFTRVGRKLVQALDSVTVDGFVFRVDMRLRPWGDGGPLVSTFDALEKYYREQGREWERYAMVKVRAIAGDMVKAGKLQERLLPFVYRSYLDYSVFSELRVLKQQIVEQQMRRNKMDNIKLGPGGIRDIEFIAQVFQLIRGGRDPKLQDRRLQHILRILAADELLPDKIVEEIIEAYKFLRVVEHRLQQYEDKQTNDLPESDVALQRLAFSMDFGGWAAMSQQLERTRQSVRAIFEQVFSAPQFQDVPAQAEAVWHSALDLDEENICKIEELGYLDSELALEAIANFKSCHVYRSLGEKGRKAINQLMPLTISAAAATQSPAQTLLRVTQFFSGVAKRSVYLSLFLEDPLALSELVKLASLSPWVLEHISHDPLLLDELLNPNKLYEPLIKQELSSALKKKLSGIDCNDIESQLQELRYFQLVYILRVAAADISGAIPLITVSDYLSDIAEVLLEEAACLAWRAASEMFGFSDVEAEPLKGFGVIASGALGARELSYDSTLELEFLFNKEMELSVGLDTRNVARFVARRLNLLMTTPTTSGKLYRLQSTPANAAGSELLIFELARFLSSDLSELEKARSVQARFLFGDDRLKVSFDSYRKAQLTSRMTTSEFYEKTIAGYRSLSNVQSDQFCIDEGEGGLNDIRWIAACGVMCCPLDDARLLDSVETMSLLYELATVGFLSMDEYLGLQRAYMVYREKIHLLDLQHQTYLVSAGELRELRAGVVEVFDRIFNGVA
jgi:glutamate-ammonia-ligase adenylyltransferase